MIILSRRLRFVLFGLLLMVSACDGGGSAEDPEGADAGQGQPASSLVSVDGAWARAVPAGSNAAVYLTLSNTGGVADRLVSASFDGAAAAEIHETVQDGDVMRMVHRPEGVELPAGETVDFKPGGLHIMLLDLTEDLEAGEAVELSLALEQHGEMAVSVALRAPTDLGP